MATRTLRFYGYGYGNTPCSLTATFNGLTVFSGNIPTTSDSSLEHVVLFTTTLDTSISGNLPMSITSDYGNITLSKIDANYSKVPVFSGNIQGVFYPNVATFTGDRLGPNVNFTLAGYYSSGAGTYTQPNTFQPTGCDSRQNLVTINGVSQGPTDDFNGVWSYTINTGDVMTCTVEVSPGQDA